MDEIVIPERSTNLILSGHVEGDAGAIAIARRLENNEKLTYLHVGFSSIGDAGAIAFARMLDTNRTLTHLDFIGNSIGDAGAFAFARALEKNRTLTHLFFGHNNIGDAGAIALARMLETNRTLIQLYLVDNPIGEAGAIAVMRVINGTTKVRPFIQPPRDECARRRILAALVGVHMGVVVEASIGLTAIRRSHGSQFMDLNNWLRAARNGRRRLPDVLVDQVGEMLYPTRG